MLLWFNKTGVVVRSPKLLLVALAALTAAGFFALSPRGICQSTFTWNGGNGSWTNSANWTISGNATGYPDEAGDIVSFTNNSGTYDVATPTAGNGTAVAGSITTNGAGTVRLGNATTFAGSLTLNSTSGAPIFSVNTGRLAIFTELIGSQGFRKTGNGTLNFNTNTLDMTNLSGNVSIEDGTVWFNQAGNLGSGSLSFSGSNTIFQHRGNFTTTFAANRSFAISSGSNINLYNQNTLSAMVINGAITGSGDLTFTNGNFTLNGVNTHSGNTTLAASGNTTSVNVSLGSGSNLSTGTFSFTSAGNASLDLGGNSQTIQNLITESSNTGSVMTISNGSLTISGGGDISLGGRGGTFTLSLANLTSFTAGSASSNFTFHSGDTTGTTTNTLTLSTNGTNTITGQTVIFGRLKAGGNATGPSYSANVNLGATNTINADVLKVGSTNSTSTITFQAGPSNPTLLLRSANGTTAIKDWIIGELTAETGGRSGQGTVNLQGGTIDALVGNLTVGLNNNSTAASNSTLIFSNGTINSENIRIGIKSGSTAPAIAASIIQNGGNVTANTITLGESGSGAATVTVNYNLSGGSLAAASIQAGGGNFSASSNRTLTMAGNATLKNYSGSNLTITGQGSSTEGLMNFVINGPSIFEAETGKSITIGANTSLSGSGNILKRGEGVLVFSLTNNNYSGNISLSAGTLTISGGNFSAASVSISNESLSPGTTRYLNIASANFLALASGSSLPISGLNSTAEGILNISLSGNSTFQADANRTISFGNFTTLSGNGSLTKTGNGTLTIKNATAYTGNISISGGSLYSESSIASPVTVNSATFGANGTILSLGLVGTSTLDISSNQTLTINSSLTGTNGFTKNGTGALILSGAETSNFSGPVTLNAGRLEISSSFETSNFTLNTATLAGNASLGNVNVTGANATFHTDSGQSLSIVGVSRLTGSANLLKTGNGTLVIGGSGNHTYNGTASLNAGSLALGGNLTNATLNFNGAPLSGTGSVGSAVVNSSTTINSTAGITISSTLSGASGISKIGSGNLTIANGTGYSGNITVSAGALYINSNSSASVALSSTTLGGNGTLQNVSATGNTTFDITSNRSLTINSSFSGSGQFEKTNAGTLTIKNASAYTGTALLSQGTLNLSNSFGSTLSMSNGTVLGGNGSIHTLALLGNATTTIVSGETLLITSALTGTSRLTKSGSGTLQLADGSTTSFSGPVSLTQGRLNANSSLANSSITLSGGTLSGNTSLGNITVSSNASVIDVTTGNALTMTSTSKFLGTSNFSKSGEGDFVIGTGVLASNTYSGVATISAGGVILSNGSRIPNASIILNGASASLEGNGTVGNLTLTSGMISPSGGGNSSVLNISSFVWNAGVVAMDLHGSNLTTSDKLALTGTFSKGTGSSFTFDFNGTGLNGGNYTLMTFASQSGFSSADFLASNLASGLEGNFNISSTSLMFSVTAVVPEPSTSLLILVGLGSWIGLHRRKKKN